MLGLFEQLQLDNPSKQKDKQSTNSLDLATSVGLDEIALQNSISPLISSSIVKHNVYHLIQYYIHKINKKDKLNF